MVMRVVGPEVVACAVVVAPALFRAVAAALVVSSFAPASGTIMTGPDHPPGARACGIMRRDRVRRRVFVSDTIGYRPSMFLGLWRDRMVLLLAYYKVRADADGEALGAIARRMHELVTRPEFGFLGSRDYRGADGDSLTIYEFEDLEGLERWRRDPEHLAAQRRGPEFFEHLMNEVCIVKRRDPMGSIPRDA